MSMSILPHLHVRETALGSLDNPINVDDSDSDVAMAG